MSWRVTLPCTRAAGRGAARRPTTCSPTATTPPVLVADEPDPAKPDDWLLHAYFDHEPTPTS